MEGGEEIIRYRGRRYKRHSSGRSSSGSVSSSSATSKEGSTQNSSPCLPPVMPKCKYSYSVEPFQHQQHKPLPSIGNESSIENFQEDEMQLQVSEPGNTLPPSSHIQLSQLSHGRLSTPHAGRRTPLPPEPDTKDANVILLKIKLSNSKTIQRRFDFMKDCVMNVILFAHYSSQTEPLNLDYVMLSDNSVPKNVYSNFSSTLGEIGLTHNTLLHYSYES